MILLIGGTIAFYHQNPDFVTPYKETARLSNRVKERLALSVTLLIGQSYYRQEQPWTLERLAIRLRVSRDILGLVLGALERAGLMKRTADKPPVYLPGWAPEATPIKAILDAVRSSEEGHVALSGVATDPVVERLEALLDAAVGQALDQRTVKDMIQDRLETDAKPRVARAKETVSTTNEDKTL
jgi:membrane protein